MTVTATTARIATLLELVPNPDSPGALLIKKVFGNIPRVIQDANIPAAVIFPGEATYDTEIAGDQTLTTTRLYRVVLFIQDAQLGTTTQGQVVTAPFFDAIINYFIARPGLPSPSNTQDVVGETALSGDGGYQLTEYPLGSAKFYHSVEFRLTVIESTNISYAD